MPQADQDKTEEPTPYRLEEARKKGEVGKSPDVSGAFVMVVFAAVLAVTAPGISVALATTTTRVISLAARSPVLDGNFPGWLLTATAPLWQSLFPLLLGILVAAVVGNLLQTGPLVATSALSPDFNRMNPAQTIKRLFSAKTIWELAKNIVKLLVLSAMCALFVWKSQAFTESVASASAKMMGDVFLLVFIKSSLYVLLVIAAVATIDLLFTKRDFMRRMRMSRRELKDEMKRRDGDPSVKSRQRQQIRELLKKTRALANVERADVVITNPTHVAVALRYRTGESAAPVVLAKGAGLIGGYIRSLASKHGVLIVRAPTLARSLYKYCEIDGMVAAENFAALAPIYREVWAKNGEMA